MRGMREDGGPIGNEHVESDAADYRCLVCGERDYELRLCREHLDAYMDENPGAERLPRPDVAEWAERYAEETTGPDDREDFHADC